MSDNKSLWSLQENKRSEDERKLFKAKVTKQKKSTFKYIFLVLVVVFISSFALTFFQDESTEICLTSTFCFDTKKDVLLYTVYIFLNIIIVVLSILVAYIIGRKLGNLIKRQP